MENVPSTVCSKWLWHFRRIFVCIPNERRKGKMWCIFIVATTGQLSQFMTSARCNSQRIALLLAPNVFRCRRTHKIEIESGWSFFSDFHFRSVFTSLWLLLTKQGIRSIWLLMIKKKLWFVSSTSISYTDSCQLFGDVAKRKNFYSSRTRNWTFHTFQFHIIKIPINKKECSLRRRSWLYDKTKEQEISEMLSPACRYKLSKLIAILWYDLCSLILHHDWKWNKFHIEWLVQVIFPSAEHFNLCGKCLQSFQWSNQI